MKNPTSSFPLKIEEPIEFFLNRPFGFFIVDIQRDLLLFSGVYGVK